MKGELVLVDSIYCEESEFQIKVSEQDFSLEIYVDEEKTLEKQLKNKKSFKYCMDDLEEFLSIIDEPNEVVVREKKYITEHFDNLLDSVEYIKLAFDEYDNEEFIKKNPLVLTKKIVLCEFLDITDYDRLMELMNQYANIMDKIYVSLNGNTDYVSLIDCYKTMNAIKQQAESIKQLGLSPMETIMFVYDIVRNRVFTLENEDESYHKSRDLKDVIFGDKIVCLGYANIFNAILNYIGIDSNLVYLIDKNSIYSGHARNVAYVKDDKYDIDGVYYFDPTWNSKKENETNEYLYRYSYFAKTRKYMDDDKNYDFEERFCPLYSIDMYKKIKKIIDSEDYEKLKPFISTMNYMSRLVTGSSIISSLHVLPDSPKYGQFNPEELLTTFEEVFNKYNKEIPAETMLRIFNNVRKLEYYQHPELYPYSAPDLYKTCCRSNWQFTDEHLSTIDRFFKGILKEDFDLEPFDNFKNYGHESGLFKDIEQVRLTKVLRLVADKESKQ